MASPIALVKEVDRTHMESESLFRFRTKNVFRVALVNEVIKNKMKLGAFVAKNDFHRSKKFTRSSPMA